MTTPYRKAKRNWRILLLVLLTMLAFGIAAFGFMGRASELNEHIYEQCVTDQVQNTIMRAQLVAAKRRVVASLPQGSAESYYQLDQLNDGIAALDDLNFEECPAPKGVGP